MSSSRAARRGFTIVELMMVVAIIGILLGIVTTAASSSVRQARSRKASACCTIVEQAFATYNAQKGHWPCFSSGITDQDGEKDDSDDEDSIVLSNSKVADMIRELIKEGRNGNPLMDISGLYVSSTVKNRTRETDNNTGRNPLVQPESPSGMDFVDAVRGTKQHKKKMSLGSMYFGYPLPGGGFKPFKVTYSVPADRIKVEQW